MSLFLKLIATIIVTALLIFIFFFGVQIYNTYNQAVSDPVPQDESGISTEMQETVDELRNAFWVNDDDLETYRVTKTKAQEVTARNSTKRDLSPVELNDEMVVMTNYGAAAVNTFPEEGLRVFAQIYNDERYTGKVRANALLHVMFYPTEFLGTEKLSVQNANDWIFTDDLLASVLEGSEYEGVYLQDNRAVLEASLIGLSKAAAISNSNSMSAKINSVIYQVRLNLIADDLLKSKNATWQNIETQAWSDTELSLATSMLDEYAVFQKQIIDAFNSGEEYNDKYVHAAKNVLNGYTTMQALGIDVIDQIHLLNDASTQYAKKYRPTASAPLAQNIDTYSGVNALYMTCSYIIENQYKLEDRSDVSKAVMLAQPFLQLSHSDLRIFIGTTSLGQSESGACFRPFVVLGQNDSEFKDALIEGVGGWNESQFE